MAEFDPLSASLIRQLSPQALTVLAPPGAAPRGNFSSPGSSLAAAARAQAENGNPVTLNVTDARAALSAAIADARTILDTLATLHAAVARAQTSSLVE